MAVACRAGLPKISPKLALCLLSPTLTLMSLGVVPSSSNFSLHSAAAVVAQGALFAERIPDLSMQVSHICLIWLSPCANQ